MAGEASIDDQIEHECVRFLYREAELLDRRALTHWLQMLSPEIDYRVPVRTTRSEADGDGFSASAFFFQEDYGSLSLRISRLESDFAWSENPPTRTRRLVTNIRLSNADDGTSRNVVSNLAVYCFRGESPEPRVLTGERQDVLQKIDGDLKLKRRLVLLDTTVLGMDSLSIFL